MAGSQNLGPGNETVTDGRANKGCTVMGLCEALCKVHARLVQQRGGDEDDDSRSTRVACPASYQLIEDTCARPALKPAHGRHVCTSCAHTSL